MTPNLKDLINIYIFTCGRRQFALTEVLRLAREVDFEELVAYCTSAIEHEKAHRHTRRAWLRAKKQPTNPRLVALDPTIDRLVGAIFDICNQAARNLGHAQPGEAAKVILDRVFTSGAYGITSKGYVEQTTEIESIVGLFRGELAEMVSVLSLDPYVDELEKRNTEFRSILAEERSEEVTWDAVRRSDRIGQENLLQAIAMIMGRHPSSSEEDIRGRAALLAPIIRQNSQIHDYYKRRRSVADVDPETGEESVELVSEPVTGSGVTEPDPSGETAPVVPSDG